MTSNHNNQDTCLQQTGFRHLSRQCLYLSCAAALFLIIVGSKLWLINTAGTDLPYWDQWNAEAGSLFIPYINKTLSIVDLFKPHNEHRIFFTRLLSLGLMLFNHQWDARLAMVVNAIIHSLSAVILFWIMIRLEGPKALGLGFLAVALAFSLPFSWENTLAGFQSQFYFLFLFSLLSIALLVLHKPMSIVWFAGVITAVASIFTMASGFLSICAVFLIITLRLLKEPETWKAGIITLLGCFMIIVISLLLTVTVKGHEVFRIRSFMAFVTAMGRNLAWPNIKHPRLAVVSMLPMIMLIFHYIRSRERNLKAEEMTIGLGFWVVLQSAAIAYARGGGISIARRYMDIMSMGMVVNAFSIVLLLTRYHNRSRTGRIWPALFGIWIILCGTGLVSLTSQTLRNEIPLRKYYYNQQAAHVRAFVATDDIRHLTGKQGEEIPYPCPYYLAQILRDPIIRKLLPASVRQPLSIRRRNTNDPAFILNGVDPATPRPEPFDVAWGSYSEQGRRSEGTFASLPVRTSSLPFLKFDIAGFLGHDNLSMKVVDLSRNTDKMLRPYELPLTSWKPFFIRAPEGKFIIVASDRHCNAWFAFKEPREVGYGSWLAVCLAKRGQLILVLGLVMAVFTMAWFYLKHLTH